MHSIQPAETTLSLYLSLTSAIERTLHNDAPFTPPRLIKYYGSIYPPIHYLLVASEILLKKSRGKCLGRGALVLEFHSLELRRKLRPRPTAALDWVLRSSVSGTSGEARVRSRSNQFRTRSGTKRLGPRCCTNHGDPRWR